MKFSLRNILLDCLLVSLFLFNFWNFFKQLNRGVTKIGFFKIHLIHTSNFTWKEKEFRKVAPYRVTH